MRLFLLLVFFSCTTNSGEGYKRKAQNPEFLHRTMKEITDRMVHDIFSPPVASRIYAYASVAAYEAVIHDHREFISLAGQLNGLDSIPQPNPALTYCFPLASTQAMLKVGRTLIFSETEFDQFIGTIHREFESTGIPADVFDRSVEYGDALARTILKWASKDNYLKTRTLPKYTPDKNPATWKATPPAYMDAVEPYWNMIRPFVLDSSSQYQPARPTSFSTDKASPFFREVTEIYEMGRNLTEDQKAIARFWDCNPFVVNTRGHVNFATKKISPGGHWINITRVVCTDSGADIVQSAEAYARVAISIADGFISCWDEKYRSLVIRPETYINQYINKDWLPLLQTPPFPEYTSGHSVISGSASVALTGLFGNSYAFTDSTEVEFSLPPRSFSSFAQAAEEAAVSRMYGGIHYRPAVENGMKQGRRVGEIILNRVVTRKKI